MSNQDTASPSEITGVVVVAVIVLVVFFSYISGQQERAREEERQQNSEIIQQLQDNVSDSYSSLTQDVQEMTGLMLDEECIWLGDNLSDSIGDYCYNSINDYYHDARNTTRSSSDIDYDHSENINDQIDSLTQAANNEFDSLLELASDAEQAMDTVCVWLSDNISDTVGERCSESYEPVSNRYSASPFRASDYYRESQ